MLDHGDWKNEYLIYLGVKEEGNLKTWKRLLESCGKKISVFREPDIKNEITALATLSDGGEFKKLKLI